MTSKARLLVVITGILIVLLKVSLDNVIIINQNINSTDFNSIYRKIIKHNPNIEAARVEEFFLVINGEKGEMEKFKVSLVTPSTKKDDVYILKNWPALHILTINHVKLPHNQSKFQSPDFQLFFAALNNLDYKDILNENKGLYTVLSDLRLKQRIYPKDPTMKSKNFIIESNNRLLKLQYEKQYPNVYEIFVIGDNTVLRSYLISKNFLE